MLSSHCLTLSSCEYSKWLSWLTSRCCCASGRDLGPRMSCMLAGRLLYVPAYYIHVKTGEASKTSLGSMFNDLIACFGKPWVFIRNRDSFGSSLKAGTAQDHRRAQDMDKPQLIAALCRLEHMLTGPNPCCKPQPRTSGLQHAVALFQLQHILLIHPVLMPPKLPTGAACRHASASIAVNPADAPCCRLPVDSTSSASGMLKSGTRSHFSSAFARHSSSATVCSAWAWV